MTPEEKIKQDAAEKEAQEISRIAKSSKRFVDNVRVLIGEGHFVLTTYCGESSETYVFTPHHAKRFSQLLSFQISQYEQQNGEIPAILDLRIPSPFQAELQGPQSDDEKPPETEGGNPNKTKGK